MLKVGLEVRETMENATINIFHASEEFWDSWEWIKAIDAFDYDDRTPLADMLRDQVRIPEYFVPIIADIVEGRRVPNKKAGVKLKVRARDRLEYAAHASYLVGVADLYLKGPHVEIPETPIKRRDDVPYDHTENHKRKLDHLADEKMIDPVEARHRLERGAKQSLDRYAASIDVSVHTLKGWMRDFRKLVQDFPVV